MPSVPKLNVRLQLILSILGIILISWILSAATAYIIMRKDILTLRHVMLADPQRYPEPIPEPRFTFVDVLLGSQSILPREARVPPRAGPPPPQGGALQPPPSGPMQQRSDGDFQQPPPPEGMGALTGELPPNGVGDGAGQPPPPRRQAMPRESTQPRLWNTVARSLIALGLALGAGLLLARRFTRPLTALTRGARAFRGGQFSYRIAPEGENEFAEVAIAMNEMAEQVAAQIKRLEDDASRRKHLLADVAHELRGPIMTMRTMAGALDEGLADDPERRGRAVQSLVRASDRLLHLVTDLMEIAKLDLGELPLHRQPVDLAELAEGCLHAHVARAQEAGVTLQPLRASGPVMVPCDPDRLAQVLDNLLDNAISYAGDGAAIQVSLAGTGPVLLTVADTGRGIPAKHLPYLFDAFYRADSARSPKDRHSGLGLRITRGLVQAHGGTLTIQSTEGKGTTATVVLPAK
jgi:signal transduction histidine kinase